MSFIAYKLHLNLKYFFVLIEVNKKSESDY